MAHPFEKMFLQALKVSTEFDNQVTEVALSLCEKGYQEKEVAQVLKKLAQGLIDPKEEALVRAALAEFDGILEE